MASLRPTTDKVELVVAKLVLILGAPEELGYRVLHTKKKCQTI